MKKSRPKSLGNRKRSVYSFLFVAVFCMANAAQVFAQGRVVVTGLVTDGTDPLPGVSVLLVDSTAGTATDANGRYSISVPNSATVLRFVYLGYTTVDQTVGSRNVIDVVMSEDAQVVEDVVVTAFATQKRINVTGSISAVGGEDIVSAPVANLSNALVGLAPGLAATQFSGEPGRNMSDIRIRGVATYGDATPLVVIDGVEQAPEQAFTTFNSLDPNDVLGVSILKDASSTAVYGIRGANGVIIVTTRRGLSGKPRVSVTANYGITNVNEYQTGLNSYEWATLRNESIDNELAGFGADWSQYRYNDKQLWKFQNNRDFTDEEINAMNISAEKKEQLRNSPGLYYFSWDAWSNIFGRVAPQYQANVNVSGGTDKVKYYTSVGYFNQESITRNYEYYGNQTGSTYSRYNYTMNLDVEVIKNTTISASLKGTFGTTSGPGTGDPNDFEGRYRGIMQYIYETTPFAAQPFIDGKLIEGYSAPGGSVQRELAETTNSSKGNQNALQYLTTRGTGYLYRTQLDNTFSIRHDMPYLTQGLYAKASVSYQDNYNRYVTRNHNVPVYMVRRSLSDPTELEFFGGGRSNETFNSIGRDQWNRLYVDGGIYYNGSFNGHSVGGMFVGKASKYTMPSGAYNTPSGEMGLVARATYDYAERYMLEFNLGYNGTEQFAPGQRFGVFPAVSAGWVPTNEAFFSQNKWITFLKFRGSYGEIGNDRIGGRRYLYLPNTFNLNQGGYHFGHSGDNSDGPYYPGAAEAALGNPNVTWERSKKINVGADLRLINDKLSLTFDWFKEDRQNILTTLGIIPGTYGVASSGIPPANVGVTTNQGYEVVLGWNDRINRFGYYIEGSVSYAHSKIIYRAEAPNPYPWMNQTGHSIGQRFGLRSDGFYDTIEELNMRPYNTFTSRRETLGDIKYIDLNGDGVIDNKDRAPIGSPNVPEYQYSIKFGFDYRGFDMRALLTGTANGSYYLSGFATIPFTQIAGNAFKWHQDGRWTQARYEAGEKITYPRLAWNPDAGTHANYLESDFWMYSSNHIKLKNIELGYSFSPNMRFMKFIGISSLRVFASANNVWTIWDCFPDNMAIDPETRDSNTLMYPLTRTINFGLNIQF